MSDTEKQLTDPPRPTPNRGAGMMNEIGVEKVAREWCRLSNVDPDQQVSHGADPDSRGYVPAIMCYSPRWHLVARVVREHELIHEAFKVAPTRGER